VKNYRKRLRQRGPARFEAMGLATDRKRRAVTDESRQQGGIHAALRRSPMVSAGIKFKREVTSGRKVDL